LVFDDHTLAKKDPAVNLPGPLTFYRWILCQLRTWAKRRLGWIATYYHHLYQSHG